MQDRARVDQAPGQASPPPGSLPIRFEAVGYSVGPTRILSDLDLNLAAGGPSVLLGPNGCGKSTLLRLAMGLIEPTAGRITFAGSSRAIRGSRAIVFQKPVMLRRSAAANVAFALRAAGRPREAAEIAGLLEIARLSDLASRPARRLSGGEQQRLALVRALARKPTILMLDEPTANLDPASTKLVEEIIVAIAATGVKIIMSTHDLGQARRIGEQIVFLAKGRLIETRPAASFFSETKSPEARSFLAGDLVI